MDRRHLDRMTDAELLSAACQLLSIPAQRSSELVHAARPTGTDGTSRTAAARCRPATRIRTATHRPHRRHLVDDRQPDRKGRRRCAGRPPLDGLTEALRHGDPETADRAFVSLCATRDQDQIVDDLVDIVLPHLGGAAHGAIFLELLPRFRPAGINPALMARTLIGEIARNPACRLRWFDQPRARAAKDASLTDRLVSPTADSEPSSHFVQPTMALVDDSGLAYRTLADVTHGLSIDEARRQLLPIAAMSMLQDEPTNAPYGWTHCLTLPQATLAVAHRASDAQRAVDVAATYVLGYRATQSSGPIDPSWEPDRPRRFVDEVTHAGPVGRRGDRLARAAGPTS